MDYSIIVLKLKDLKLKNIACKIENMEIFLYNFNFIWFNSFLALISVVFGWLMIKARKKFAKILYGFIWLIFLPNTIYILTDITHLFEDWPKVDNLLRAILIIQYTLFSIVGIITFTIAVYFFQKLLDRKSKKKMKPSTFVSICILNFMVGFAVVLGGIQRTNSWHIFTDPIRVANDVLDVLSSKELLMLSLGIGVFANLVYFLMAETVVKWSKQFFKNGGP